MNKPLAVQRRDYIANSGPALLGVKRMEKVRSPQNEVFVFLGVREGEAILEREDKTKGQPFIIIDSSDFVKYNRIG